ncbi:MAG: ABC transporter ATP-binding protein [Acidimicrobiia bacterium]
MALLELDHLTKAFPSRRGDDVVAVRDLSLSIEAGESVGLIGESGSGKSTVGRLALRLLEPSAGRVRFEGVDLGSLGRQEMRQVRSRLQVVFQEPLQSLDPRQRVGRIVAEPLVLHRPDLGPAQRRAVVAETLVQVGLGGSIADRYPRQLSGGQQQRVGIARAIVTRPSFVVLDEPTSSLDLSVRAQILDLLSNLRRELGVAYLFISHDLDTVEYIADRTLVMYRGSVVESGPTEEVLRAPRHPYSKALLSSSLSVDPSVRPVPIELEGDPGAGGAGEGCPLRARCPVRVEACRRPVPVLDVAPGHHVACVHAAADARRVDPDVVRVS